MDGQLVDRHLLTDKRPEHLHAGGVSEHPEHLGYQIHLILGQSTPTATTICIHTQIVSHHSHRQPAELGPILACGSPAVSGDRCAFEQRRVPAGAGRDGVVAVMGCLVNSNHVRAVGQMTRADDVQAPVLFVEGGHLAAFGGDI